MENYCEERAGHFLFVMTVETGTTDNPFTGTLRLKRQHSLGRANQPLQSPLRSWTQSRSYPVYSFFSIEHAKGKDKRQGELGQRGESENTNPTGILGFPFETSPVFPLFVSLGASHCFFLAPCKQSCTKRKGLLNFSAVSRMASNSGTSRLVPSASIIHFPRIKP